MSFQNFLLVGHWTNWTGHNLLTDNTLKKTQDVLVTCSVIAFDHNVKLAGHFQNLVVQCPMTDCYFQHWIKFQKCTNTVLLSIPILEESPKNTRTIWSRGNLRKTLSIILFQDSTHQKAFFTLPWQYSGSPDQVPFAWQIILLDPFICW